MPPWVEDLWLVHCTCDAWHTSFFHLGHLVVLCKGVYILVRGGSCGSCSACIAYRAYMSFLMHHRAILSYLGFIVVAQCRQSVPCIATAALTVSSTTVR